MSIIVFCKHDARQRIIEELQAAYPMAALIDEVPQDDGTWTLEYIPNMKGFHMTAMGIGALGVRKDWPWACC